MKYTPYLANAAALLIVSVGIAHADDKHSAAAPAAHEAAPVVTPKPLLQS